MDEGEGTVPWPLVCPSHPPPPPPWPHPSYSNFSVAECWALAENYCQTLEESRKFLYQRRP
jgi:hypothetical protein